jgi:hypothetical protein
MSSTGFWPLDGVEPDLAVGYIPPADDAPPGSPAAAWRTNVYSVPAMGLPDGGVQATAVDLATALDGLTGRGVTGAAFLTGPTRERMIGPHVTNPVSKASAGLGVIHNGTGATARIGHSGEDPGFSSRAWVYTASGERVVVQSNVTEGAWVPFDRLDELLAAAS